ncbi:hypothetical protein L873DRAFT_1771670 [Choiromyces venosus 120613-1]|uniref:Tc1-like transposase DDE domain-containing protein n=1 Tax=Choiromyces venosus 120613-1 TaxID=1336337 RepID=A0A3N4JLG2_9PEZI|nr:hypothetical protein L873DRAFT_1771670 [Choiromyces venosus 120613-1]
MNKHHNLFRYKWRSKPPLDAQNKLDCLALVDWGLAQPIESFIFSDKMIFEVGSPRRLRNITWQKGEDPYASATPDKKKSGFSIMVSGSVALGFKGPLWVWVKESPEEQAANNQQLQRENNELNATIPGTEEYLYLQALNRNIAEYNANCSPHEPHHIPRRPFWEFGEKIQKRSLGGGLDWFLYRESILHQCLYPFIEAIQTQTGRHCWLVEDNAGNHTLAAKMDLQEAAARNIHRIPKWLANSPDLNEIEPCWNYLKDAMMEYNFAGVGEQTRQEVIDALRLEWEHMPQELIDHFCMNFHLNLLQVRAWGGDNKFNA